MAHRSQQGFHGQRALVGPPAVDGGLANTGARSHALQGELVETDLLEHHISGIEDGVMADGIPAATGGRVGDEGERNDVLQMTKACIPLFDNGMLLDNLSD
jgi:hypothetical protein